MIWSSLTMMAPMSTFRQVERKETTRAMFR